MCDIHLIKQNIYWRSFITKYIFLNKQENFISLFLLWKFVVLHQFLHGNISMVRSVACREIGNYWLLVVIRDRPNKNTACGTNARLSGAIILFKNLS